jgi:hypothetical protein
MFEVVLAFLPFTPSPVFVFTVCTFAIVVHEFLKKIMV